MWTFTYEFSTIECQECKFQNNNEHCEQWADHGYCSGGLQIFFNIDSKLKKNHIAAQ